MTLYEMIAADAHGSIAVMPISVDDLYSAEQVAKSWLATWDHGFIQAYVSQFPETIALMDVASIRGVIFNLSPDVWLMDHAEIGTPEEMLEFPHLIPAAWVAEEIEPTVDEVDLDNFVNRLEREFWNDPTFPI